MSLYPGGQGYFPGPSLLFIVVLSSLPTTLWNISGAGPVTPACVRGAPVPRSDVTGFLPHPGHREHQGHPSELPWLPPSSPAPCFPFPRTRGGGDLLLALQHLPPSLTPFFSFSGVSHRPFEPPLPTAFPRGPTRLSSFESKKYRATIFLVDSPCLIFVCSLTPPFPQKCLHYDRQ